MITSYKDYEDWFKSTSSLKVRETKIQLAPDEDFILSEKYKVEDENGLHYEEKYFDIDLNERSIVKPYSTIGVEGDIEAETIYFRVNRFFDNQNLFPTNDFNEKFNKNFYDNILIAVEYVNAVGDSGFDLITDADAYSSGIEDEKDILIIPWTLSSGVTAHAGIVTFALRFFKLNYVDSKGFSYSLKKGVKTPYTDNDYQTSKMLQNYFEKNIENVPTEIDEYEKQFKEFYSENNTQEAFLSALEEYEQNHIWRSFDEDDLGNIPGATTIDTPIILMKNVEYALNTLPTTLTVSSGLKGFNFELEEEEYHQGLSNIYKLSGMLYDIIHGNLWVPSMDEYVACAEAFLNFNELPSNEIIYQKKLSNFQLVEYPKQTELDIYYEKREYREDIPIHQEYLQTIIEEDGVKYIFIPTDNIYLNLDKEYYVYQENYEAIGLKEKILEDYGDNVLNADFFNTLYLKHSLVWTYDPENASVQYIKQGLQLDYAANLSNLPTITINGKTQKLIGNVKVDFSDVIAQTKEDLQTELDNFKMSIQENIDKIPEKTEEAIEKALSENENLKGLNGLVNFVGYNQTNEELLKRANLDNKEDYSLFDYMGQMEDIFKTWEIVTIKDEDLPTNRDGANNQSKVIKIQIGDLLNSLRNELDADASVLNYLYIEKEINFANLDKMNSATPSKISEDEAKEKAEEYAKITEDGVFGLVRHGKTQFKDALKYSLYANLFADWDKKKDTFIKELIGQFLYFEVSDEKYFKVNNKEVYQIIFIDNGDLATNDDVLYIVPVDVKAIFKKPQKSIVDYVESVEKYVGVIPEDFEAETIVEYINTSVDNAKDIRVDDLVTAVEQVKNDLTNFKIDVDNELKNDSTNPVENQAIFNYLKDMREDLEEKIGGIAFTPISISKFILSKEYAEKGSTINDLTYEIETSPHSDNVVITPDIRGSFTETTTFIAKAIGRGEDDIAEASAVLTFCYPIYYGVAKTLDNYIDLSNKILNGETAEGRYSVNAKENDYIYFAIPTEYSAIDFYVNGFNGGFDLVGTEDIYNIYKSTNANLGEVIIQIINK